MLSGKYRRIYYYHLKKCGGSTLNYWLDTLTSDDRVHKLAWRAMSGFEQNPVESAWADSASETSICRTLFQWTDILHSHAPLRMYAPDNTFCFTILRDPVQRLISQIQDWRRLEDCDTCFEAPEVRKYIQDSRRYSLRDFLERHATAAGRMFLDNYLTRALAGGRIGNLAEDVVDPERLCEIALHSLENDYHLVGTTENQDLARNAFCAMAGFPPAAKIPMINMTRKSIDTDHDLNGAQEILESLTRVDRILYDRARQLFQQRHRQTAQDYDTAAFEAQYATPLLREMRGTGFSGATRFSVRQPIIGAGMHGRDGAGWPECAVWTGPETRTTLYIPTPANMDLSLLVWIRGYVDGRQREQLRVKVDGKPVRHQFAVVDGYADLLVIPSCSTRDFVRLELEIDETLKTGEPGDEVYDSRERGIAFDSYGWCPT
jgi:hypothetical protein